MRRFGQILTGLGIFLLTVVVFSRAIPYGLANIDDYVYVWKHVEVTDGLTWNGIKWAFVVFDDAIWMPLTWISYQLDFTLFGHAAHLHSILIHAVNTILVWRFLTLLFPVRQRFDVLPPLLGALLWALHPLRVESVVWIASRKDVLSFTGLIAALIFWVGWRRTGKGLASRDYWLSLGCFLLGACAKPSVMTFPFLALILDWFVLDRTAVRRRWYAYIPPVLLALAIAAEGALLQRIGGATAMESDIPLWWRTLNAAAAFGLYLWHTACPVGLAVQCTLRYPAAPRFLLPGIVLCGLVGWYSYRRIRSGRDPLVAGLLWFAVAIGPMLGIASFGFHAFADRFTYIPSLGLSLALIGLLRTRPTPLPSLLAGLAAVACGVLTFRQIGFWQDDRTLLTHTIEVDGSANANAQFNLGRYYFEFEHDLDRAIACFRAALAADPSIVLNQPQFHMFALCEKGELQEALAYKRFLGEWNNRFTADQREPGDPPVMTARYALAHTALAMTDSQGRAGLEADIDHAIAGCRGKLTRDWIYLKGRLALLEGDEQKARRIWSTMPDDTVRTEDPYMTYRYLRSETAPVALPDKPH